MNDARKPRSTQTREIFAPQALGTAQRLDAPEAPPGYQHRWIRTALRGEEDKINVIHDFVRDGNLYGRMSTLDPSLLLLMMVSMRELLETVG